MCSLASTLIVAHGCQHTYKHTGTHTEKKDRGGEREKKREKLFLPTISTYVSTIAGKFTRAKDSMIKNYDWMKPNHPEKPYTGTIKTRRHLKSHMQD